jgi:hypothetical protein
LRPQDPRPTHDHDDDHPTEETRMTHTPDPQTVDTEADRAVESFHATWGRSKFLPSKRLAARERGPDGTVYFRFYSDGSLVVKSRDGDLQPA